MSLIVKVYNNDDIRRVRFERSLELITCVETLRQVYNIPAISKISLKWHDGEDLISIVTNGDLRDAIENVEGGPLKLYLFTNSKVTHPGVKCDDCNQPLSGNRYKCLECPNYDQCEDCFSRHQHAQHALLVLATPNIRPHTHFMEVPVDVLQQQKTGHSYHHYGCHQQNPQHNHEQATAPHTVEQAPVTQPRSVDLDASEPLGEGDQVPPGMMYASLIDDLPENIKNGYQQMISMGFPDNGRLVELLIDKNGDVEAAVESIHPKSVS